MQFFTNLLLFFKNIGFAFFELISHEWDINLGYDISHELDFEGGLVC